MTRINLVFNINGKDLSDDFDTLSMLHKNGMKIKMFGYEWRMSSYNTHISGPTTYMYGDSIPHYIDENNLDVEIHFEGLEKCTKK